MSEVRNVGGIGLVLLPMSTPLPLLVGSSFGVVFGVGIGVVVTIIVTVVLVTVAMALQLGKAQLWEI
jgi:hypothetical protein